MRPERPWRVAGGQVSLPLRLTPKGGRDAFDGFAVASDGKSHALARVRAVPEDGAANAALIALLAKVLDCRKSAISLASGATSRLKMLEIEDGEGRVQAALEALWRAHSAGTA